MDLIFKRILSLLTMTALAAGTMLCVPLQVQGLSEEEISAPSAVLMDSATGTVLFEKAAHEVRACASITKVMTLLLVMEALDSGKLRLSDTVTASEHAASMGGSDIWLEPGETMTADEMIKATIVASANDAAVALAEHISGTEDAFVAEMNQKAKSLNMKETVFKNCNGLDEEGHVTSAYDVAVMSRELLRHPTILKYSKIWMDELRGGKTQLVNTNKLLKSYKGITGLKTGTTSQAGSCISATAQRDGLELIAVVLGSPSGKERFSDAAKLLDHGFANYAVYTPKLPGEAFVQLPVEHGTEEFVKTTAVVKDKFLIKKGGDQEISCEVKLPESVRAPVEKGQTLGSVVYKNSGEGIAEYPITAKNAVAELQWQDVLIRLLRVLTGGQP